MGTSRSASQTSSGGSKEPVVVEQRRYVRHDGVDPLRGNRVLSGGAVCSVSSTIAVAHRG
jgi:hypothetical protein